MAKRKLLRGTMGAGVLLALAASCGPADEIAEYCEEACDCYGCSDDDKDVCIAKYERRLAVAEAYECDEKYLEYLGCVARKSDCDESDSFSQDCTNGCPCDRDQEDYDECIDDASKIKTRCECTCNCELAADVPGGACLDTSADEMGCCATKCADVCAAAGFGTNTSSSSHCRG